MRMKYWQYLAAVMMSLVVVTGVTAQEKGKKTGGQLEILGDYFEFSSTNRVLNFKGNVIVNDPPETQIKCDDLTVNLGTNGTQVQKIFAQGHVIITFVDKDGKKVARGKEATYEAAKDILTITGDPEIDMSFGTLTGADKVVLERSTGFARAYGRYRIVSKPGALPEGGFLKPGSSKSAPKK